MRWLQGRLNRRDYIVSQIIGTIIAWPLFMEPGNRQNEQFILAYNLLVLGPLIILVIGITVRRLHDLNRGGWYALVNFIPLIAIGFQVYLMLAKGNAADNKYGKALKTEVDLVHIFFNR